jgi:hypothetical protein
MGGELHNFWYAVGGWSSEVGLGATVRRGGELGGVIWDCEGTGPGGQYGKCLLGTGVDGRFKVKVGPSGGGVVDCRMSGGCWTTTVAIM